MSITIPIFPTDFPEAKILHYFKTKKTYLLPQKIELLMTVTKGDQVIKFQNKLVNHQELERLDNVWLPYVPYFTNIFGLRSTYSANQFVKLLWTFEKRISGNIYYRIDEYLSKSVAEQRAAQLQFISRWKDLFVQKIIKPGLFPVDSWDSGKKQPEKAKSVFDLSLIQLFHQWLDK
eukprot:81237_1